MTKNNQAGRILNVILLVAGLVLALGVHFVFHACGPMEDGSFMACHWAEHGIMGCGIAICVLALIGIVVPSSAVRGGIDIGVAVTGILAIAMPGTLINTCMMADMMCNTMMKPAAMVCGAVIVIIAVVAAVRSIVGSRGK